MITWLVVVWNNMIDQRIAKKLVYLHASYWKNHEIYIVLIYLCLIVDQFGYGFGK